MKILISWLAFKHDFDLAQDDIQEKVRKSGPTYTFHEHFFDQENYDRHYILSTEMDDDPRIMFLLNRLRIDFPEHQVEGVYLSIKDVIDINEIKTKVQEKLLELDADQIDIFVSPGTPAMQTAWYICKTTLGLNMRLLQTREARFTESKKPELIETEIETSSTPVSAILSQRALGKSEAKEDYLISPSIEPLYLNARKVAETDRIPVLILGETGTGKEHLARYIHDHSIRKEGSYITVNCSALGDNLLESRLFGYKKGAFTGAQKDKKGIFEEANGGTVFLDEIGDISPYMQQALLRVLQEGEIMPIGSNKPKRIDIRVIAASNKSLPEACSVGDFRWDLYYRLAVVELEIPSLQERGTDELKQMIEFFVKQEKKNLRKATRLQISKEVMAALLAYEFPGNLRELENLIRRLYVFSEGPVTLEDLPKRIFANNREKSLRWEDAEKAHIEYVLKLKKGNQRQAYQALGYGAINTLRTKIKKYDIKVRKQ